MAVTVSRDLPLQRRERLELSAKAVIGRTAAALAKPGDTILLDAGTTVLALARCLRAARSLTVVTNSLEVLPELRDRPGLRVVAPLTAFNAVITDAGIASSALSQLERHARQVVVAR